jgi:hypothetical protein
VVLPVGAVAEQGAQQWDDAPPEGRHVLVLRRKPKRYGSVVTRVLIHAAKGTQPGYERMETHVGAAATHERQREQVGKYYLEEEIRRRHVASADSPAGSRRVVNRVPEDAHEAQVWPVKEVPMDNVLDNVVADGHGRQRENKSPQRKLGAAGEAETSRLRQGHARQKNGALVAENSWEKLDVGLLVDLAGAEGS